MPATWWANERATEPPIVTLIPTEERKVAVGLEGAINPGESIVNGTVIAEVRRWRDNLTLDPQPTWGLLSFDGVTKTAAIGIDASALPYGEPCALIITFDVSYGAGTETRSSFVILVAKL